MSISDIHEGDRVKICHINNPKEYSIGEIHKILQNTSEEKIVILRDGTKGDVVNVINSKELIEKRIMHEDQYTENKANFCKENMFDESIPKAVQSFLNSDGGYLYIGVSDSGTLQERLTGLDSDFDAIQKSNKLKTDAIQKSDKLKTDELCDKLERRIMDSLNKYLTSVIPIGKLLTFDFIDIQNVRILEIKIKKSSKPWFYRNLAKGNKPLEFVALNKNGEKRCVEDFYIRNVGGKKLIPLNSDVYIYSQTRFKN